LEKFKSSKVGKVPKFKSWKSPKVQKFKISKISISSEVGKAQKPKRA
jgi:hypothetical protein